METILTVCGIDITRYGLGCALAFLLAIILQAVCCKRFKVPYSAFIQTACISVPMVLVMSRLIYVLANCTYYLTTLSNPGVALYFWDGGYSMTGALAGGCLACLFNKKEYRIRLLDSVGPAFLLGAGVERLF